MIRIKTNKGNEKKKDYNNRNALSLDMKEMTLVAF